MKVKLGKNPKKESPTPLLQKWHKNEIFKAIQTVGLDPRNFDLNDSGAEVRIKDRSSASCFIVRRESGYYVGQYVVGTVRFGHIVPVAGILCCRGSVGSLKKPGETSTPQIYGPSFSERPSCSERAPTLSPRIRCSLWRRKNRSQNDSEN
jgi:hypothetical protein